MGAITPELARSLVATAARAPSVHNTQPWRFRLVDGALELRADHDRRLAVADPAGRQLTISCGAALRTLRLALRTHGLRADVRYHDPARPPHVLAVVRAVPATAPSAAERRLAAAVYRRHTHRGAFDGGPVDDELLAELAAQARPWGAELRPVPAGAASARLVATLRAAAAGRATAPQQRAELLAWTPAPGQRRRDGVPARSYPQRRSVGLDVPARDFDLGRAQGRGDPPAAADFRWVALTTPGDGWADWLAGGEALQSALLAAASRWAFAAVHTEPLEVPALRRRLAADLGGAGVLQVLLRMGYARRAALTPRRDVAEVLEPAEPAGSVQFAQQ